MSCIHNKCVYILFSFLVMPGCATIISGKSQEVSITPPTAHIEVFEWDGKMLASSVEKGNGTVDAPRPKGGRSYLIRAQAEGQCPQYWLTEYKENQTVWWNLLLGGLIGATIDGASGAAWSISPDEFSLSQGRTPSCG